MMAIPDPLLDSRDLCLVPTLWWQTMLSADPQHPPHEVRGLGFQAKARWFGDWDWNWFGDRARADILFNIHVLSDTTALKRDEEQEPSPEGKGTIGGLRYQDE